jgi:hypothetical protein
VRAPELLWAPPHRPTNRHRRSDLWCPRRTDITVLDIAAEVVNRLVEHLQELHTSPGGSCQSFQWGVVRRW